MPRLSVNDMLNLHAGKTPGRIVAKEPSKMVVEPDWHNNPLDHDPKGREFHVMFRPKLGLWTISDTIGITAACSYDYADDAWEYACKLARTERCAAQFWSRDGSDDKRVDFSEPADADCDAVA